MKPIYGGCLSVWLLAIAAPNAQAQADATAETDEHDEPAVAVGAELFSRIEAREDYDDYGLTAGRIAEGDRVVYRARLELALAPVDIGRGLTAAVRFHPQASGTWGQLSGGLEDPAVTMHQAALRLASGAGWLDIGRFEMIYGEHLVIGNVGWHETGRAFDGARLHGPLGESGAYVDAFVTMLAEGALVGATNPPLAGDMYFYGAYAGIGPMLAEALELDFYLLFNTSPQANDGPMPRPYSSTETTVGVRAKSTVGLATLRGEAGVQVGERPGSQDDVHAYQVDADAMFAVADAAAIGVGALYASGDDPTTSDLEGWNQLYPTAHKFLGLMDIIGPRSNVAALSGKLRGRPRADVDLGLDGHVFVRPETATAVDGLAGYELDGWAEVTVGTGLSLRVLFAAFIGNDDGPFGTGELAQYGEIQLSYRR